MLTVMFIPSTGTVPSKGSSLSPLDIRNLDGFHWGFDEYFLLFLYPSGSV